MTLIVMATRSGNAASDHVANGSAAQIMKEQFWHASHLAYLLPCATKIAGLPFSRVKTDASLFACHALLNESVD
jgi:hypothetical protein